MKLIRCQIVRFGCLSEKEIRFEDGVNLFYGENGAGKSTFAVFLKAMLYGFPGNKKSGITDNERKRYRPWNGGRYGGALEWETDGKQYRVERFFGDKEKDDRVKVFDLQTRKETDIFAEPLGETLFGVDADGFERSLYLSQRLPFHDADNNTIRARLGELLDASDDLGDFEAADKLLYDAHRRYRGVADRGVIADLTAAIGAKRDEIAACRAAEENAAKCEAEAQEAETECEKYRGLLAEVRAEREEQENRRVCEERRRSYLSFREAADNARRELLPYEEMFAARMPTDEEWKAASDAQEKAVRAREAERNAHLSPTDRDALAALTAKYAAGAPDEVRISAVAEAQKERYAAEQAMAANAPRQSADEEALLAHFADRVPDERELLLLRNDVSAYNAAQKEVLAAEGSGRTPRFVLPLLLAAGVLIAGGVVCFFLAGIVLAAVLCAVGLAAGITGGIGLAMGARKKDTHFKEVRRYRATIAEAVRPYRYEEADPVIAATLLCRDTERYLALRKRQAEEKKLYDEALARRDAAEKKIATLCAPYGNTVTPGSDIAAVWREDAERLTRLTEAADGWEEARMRAAAEAEENEAAVAEFLDGFNDDGLPPRGALDRLRDNMTLCRQLAAASRNAKAALDDYLARTGFDPETPVLPVTADTDELTHREKELTEGLTAAAGTVSRCTAEAEKLRAAASEEPHLCSEEASLCAEKEAAERRCALLSKAQEILTQAKSDLSTRYLHDMEAYFAAHMTALGQNDPYYFDTELNLTVEKAGERRSVKALSKGESDRAALCARLALIDAIFTKEVPFLLLDDPFVNLDDAACTQVCALLDRLSEKFQILYTVCSRSRLPQGKPYQEI